MSWLDRLPLSRLALLVAMVAPLGLTACNVRPLYGTVTDSGALEATLNHIDVSPAEGRVGQILRNELLFLLNGGNPTGIEHVVDLETRTRFSDIVVRRIGGQPQGRTVTVQADFALRPHGAEQAIFSGRVTRQAAYERSNQRFANDRAELDAEERAAKEAAEEIRIRLSAFFATGGAVQPQASPDIAPDLDDLTEIPTEDGFSDLDALTENPGAADVPLPD